MLACLAEACRIVGHLLALTNTPTEDHHLLELRLHRSVDAQVGEVTGQPAHELGVEHVERDDEYQHTVVLQQRDAALIEQLLQPRAALSLITDVAIDTTGQIAVGRIEKQQPEGLPGNQRVHQVAVQTTIDESARMGRALRVVLDGKRLHLLAPEGMSGFGDRHAFAGAGIEDAQGAGRRRQCGQDSFQRGFVRREVAVAYEIARKARKHESHGNLL